jgi:hypothetical protein
VEFDTEVDLWETGCENWMLMEVAHHRVYWWPLVLAVLNLRLLVPRF